MLAKAFINATVGLNKLNHESFFIFIISSAVLSDPAKRFDYDFTGIYEIDKYTLRVWTVYFDRILLGLLFSSESHVSVFEG